MKRFAFALFFLIAIQVIASSTILEREEPVPLHPSWVHIKEARSEEVTLRIAVKQRNLDILEVITILNVN